MEWWAWITVGAILLGSELTFVNAQFYLVFIGGAALVVGFLDLVGAPLADWMQWALFAVLIRGLARGFSPPGVRAIVSKPSGDERRTRG